MAPTPVLPAVRNVARSTTSLLHSLHNRKSFAGWFKTLVSSRDTSQGDSYELGDLPRAPTVSHHSPRADLNLTPDTGSAFEQGLPKTPTAGTFYSSPHRIQGIADWFKSWTGGSKKPHQDQDESYELDTLVPCVPRVSRYPPQVPEIDLGPTFHVGNIFGRDLHPAQIHCKSISSSLC